VAWLNWQGTVYHGLPQHLYTPAAEPGNYLTYVGRISPEKRVDRAIELARRFGMPFRFSAKVDAADMAYFRDVVEPLLDDPLVEFVGETGEAAKNELLRNAYAFLFPIDWPEPFGLAMIESMACGTPVIAFRCGSVPEVVDDGVTGFIVDSMEGALGALERVPSICRGCCRRRFEERFSATRMASDYLALYERAVNGRRDWPLAA
jgi:glycosyltransferase involved in cell wall biosynthesis